MDELMEYIIESQVQRNVEKRIILPDDMNEQYHIWQLTLRTHKDKNKEKDREPNSFICRVGTRRKIQTIWTKDLSQIKLHVSAADTQPDICPWDSQLGKPNQNRLKTFSKEMELLFAIRVSFFCGFTLKACVSVTPCSKNYTGSFYFICQK